MAYAPSPSVVPPAAGLELSNTANCATGITLKLATNVLFAVIVNCIFELVETLTPFSVQSKKVYHVLALADTVTLEPALNEPAPVVVPPAAGLADKATVN